MGEQGPTLFKGGDLTGLGIKGDQFIKLMTPLERLFAGLARCFFGLGEGGFGTLPPPPQAPGLGGAFLQAAVVIQNMAVVGRIEKPLLANWPSISTRLSPTWRNKPMLTGWSSI